MVTTTIDPIAAVDLAYTQGADVWELMVSIGQSDEEEMSVRRWRQGDLAIRIDKHYGENTIAKFANAIAVNTSTLKQRKTMSAYYDSDTRYHFQTVGYSHFRTAMKLCSLEKSLWALQKADERLWPVWKFERLLTRLLGKERRSLNGIDGTITDRFMIPAGNFITIRIDNSTADWIPGMNVTLKKVKVSP